MGHDVPCTVDVTAEGMTRGGSITVTADPVSVEQFHFTLTEDRLLQVSWDYWGTAAQGWLLEYSVDGMAQPALTLSENNAKLLWVPGCDYRIQVTALDVTEQFGGSCSYLCPQAPALDQWGVTADTISGNLCIRPETENWTAQDVAEDGYTTVFSPGQAIGLVLSTSGEPEFSDTPVTVQFQLRNAHGELVSIEQYDIVLALQWTADGCCLDIPWMANTTGEYTISVYCDSSYVGQWSFSLQETE